MHSPKIHQKTASPNPAASYASQGKGVYPAQSKLTMATSDSIFKKEEESTKQEPAQKTPTIKIPLSPAVVPNSELAAPTGLPDKSPSSQAGKSANGSESGVEVESGVKATQEAKEKPKATTYVKIDIPLIKYKTGYILGSPLIIGKSLTLELSTQPYLYGTGYEDLAVAASIKLLSWEIERKWGTLGIAAKTGFDLEHKAEPALGSQEASQETKPSFKAGVEAEYKPPMQKDWGLGITAKTGLDYDQETKPSFKAGVEAEYTLPPRFKIFGLQPFLSGSATLKVKPKEGGGTEVKPEGEFWLGLRGRF